MTLLGVIVSFVSLLVAAVSLWISRSALSISRSTYLLSNKDFIPITDFVINENEQKISITNYNSDVFQLINFDILRIKDYGFHDDQLNAPLTFPTIEFSGQEMLDKYKNIHSFNKKSKKYMI